MNHVFVNGKTGQRKRRVNVTREDGQVVVREFAYVNGVESVAAILRSATKREETLLLAEERREDLAEAKAELLATLPERLRDDPGLASLLLQTRGATLEELRAAGWEPPSKRRIGR